MIPLATTTVTVRRPAGDDPYETPGESPVVAAGLAAHISAPSGSERFVGGQAERVDAVLLIDAGADVAHTDIIDDDLTGERWDVAWVRKRTGLGLDHLKAGLRAFKGAAVA